MDNITTILKILSLLIAAFFAVLGTMTDYKDEGQVTKWGRIAIIGVIVSSLISVGLLGLEESSKNNDKIAAQNKANDEKKELYDKFNKLFNDIQVNIGKTTETLARTDEVAVAVKSSLGAQQLLAEKTQDISSGVQKNLESQNKLFEQSKYISGDVRKNLESQNRLFEQSEGIGNTLLKSVVKQDSTFQKAQELQVKLNNAARLLNPLSQLAVKYSLKYPLQDENFSTYVSRLKSIANSLGQNSVSGNNYISNYIEVLRENNQISRITVKFDSPYFPREDDPAASFFNAPLFPMMFGKNMNDNSGNNSSDLFMHVYAWSSLRETRNITSEFEVKSNQYSQWMSLTVDFTAQDEGIYVDVFSNIVAQTFQTNKVVAFQDLPGSRLTLNIPCGSELKGLQFITGNSYGIHFNLPVDKFAPSYPDSKVSKNCINIQHYDIKEPDFDFF